MMSKTIDVTRKVINRDAPEAPQRRPPPWPDPGTPEYEARLARMREGHKKRLQAQQKAQRAAPVAEPDLIDTGEPKAVRMAPEAPEKPKAKGASRSKDSEIDEPKVREYLNLAFDYLASRPNAEHWRRDEEEIALISVPGTRCYNRLDKKMREKLQAISDPAALIFGCCVVIGPSLMQELAQYREKQTVVPRRPEGPRPQPRPQPVQRQPEAEAAHGFGGNDFAGPGPVSVNGTASPAPVPDLPAIGI